MKLYLMRHGKPVLKEENPSRPLSEQGRQDVEGIAKLMKRAGIRIEKIYHSGKARARETAEIIAAGLNPNCEPLKKDGLSPMDDVNGIAQEINGWEDDHLIAGYLPHLVNLVSLLVTGDESKGVVTFQEGGVVCLEPRGEKIWSIAWMLAPDILQDY